MLTQGSGRKPSDVFGAAVVERLWPEDSAIAQIKQVGEKYREEASLRLERAGELDRALAGQFLCALVDFGGIVHQRVLIAGYLGEPLIRLDGPDAHPARLRSSTGSVLGRWDAGVGLGVICSGLG